MAGFIYTLSNDNARFCLLKLFILLNYGIVFYLACIKNIFLLSAEYHLTSSGPRRFSVLQHIRRAVNLPLNTADHCATLCTFSQHQRRVYPPDHLPSEKPVMDIAIFLFSLLFRLRAVCNRFPWKWGAHSRNPGLAQSAAQQLSYCPC